MSILMPDAQQFVIVGTQLKDELNKIELFNKYFQDKQNQLKYLDNVDQLEIEQLPELNRTLFIIKHFDFDPNPSKHHHQLQQNGSSGDSSHTNGYNNNHIANPQLTRLAEEESEVGSVGYTTDYDDIDEEPMDQTEKPADTDYDGGHCFTTLINSKCCIMGSVAFLQSISQLKSQDQAIRMIPSERPLHNLAMQNIRITFSRLSTKQEAKDLLTLTRYMGAKSREDVTNKTTHLVAGNPRGIKYRKALEWGLCIMNTSWVWESYRLAQSNLDFDAGLPEIVQRYKLKPFHGLHMAFVGFRDEDSKELCELTLANEGIIATPTSLSCTHVVVDAISGFDDANSQLLGSINQNSGAHVVYKEWFWASLEMEGKANEDAYAVPGFKPQTRRSSKVQRSSTGVYNHSFSNVLSPMLDYSRSPDSMLERQVSRSQSVSHIAKEREQPDLSQITARHRACLELLQTEKNYVRVLDTIVNLFKVPLEHQSDTSDPILPMADVKIIFGNLTPIYEIHRKMLSKLEILIECDWNETNCIGEVFVKNSIQLLKAYPPFVNFFEDTKKTISACDLNYPRFHAFLKRCQSKIQCNRESLTEMLIRPVQRLPSISLIITELIKRTDDSNPDKKHLMDALESIRRVMNLINEDKRKTEGQIAMFDIVNSIEGCPPDLLSALRRFVCIAEARLLYMNSETEVSPSQSHKVVLILFSDLIAICKKRSLRGSHSFKGTKTHIPTGRGINKNHLQIGCIEKKYRYLDRLRLCDIMNLYKRCEASDMSDAIVIQARPSVEYDQNFRYCPFVIDDESFTKATFIDRLEESICTCEDPDQVSEYMPNELAPISTGEIDFGYTNSLVSSMVPRMSSRISRAFSFKQFTLSPSLKSQRRI